MALDGYVVKLELPELKEFSKDKAVFLVETPSVCTLHYIVKYENGMLNIYQPQENQAEPTLYKSIEMDAVNDAAVEEGIIFDSLEQVESYLENIESWIEEQKAASAAFFDSVAFCRKMRGDAL